MRESGTGGLWVLICETDVEVVGDAEDMTLLERSMAKVIWTVVW